MSRFSASAHAEHVLRTGRMIGPDETPADMVERVAQCLARQELQFTNPREAASFADDFERAFDAKEIVMSTPVLTNAGRHPDRPLTACAVPTAEFGRSSAMQLRSEIVTLHEQGMGTGFNLDTTADPVNTLQFLNEVAVASAASGREDRPVGNMAILSIRHPKVLEFIDAKVDTTSGVNWKFNISIALDKGFMDAVQSRGDIELDDGKRIDADALFDAICQAATVCADPGVVFLDRMNARNPIPAMGLYTTTAPCAEVGLVTGETCQFGYLNVAKFVTIDEKGQQLIRWTELEHATALMVRALDDCLAHSQQNLGDPQRARISRQKRKIGIGLCGTADALSSCGIPYDSDVARELMTDILSFVNFASKEASVRLAEKRGPFGAMNTIVIGNRHRESPGHIERLYGQLTTHSVAAEEWRTLSRRIAATGMLRNVSTIALPPTGRSSLVIDSSAGVEPHFDTFAASPEIIDRVERTMRSRYGESIYGDRSSHSEAVQRVLASATEIEFSGHIGMAAALQRYTDEAVAKTINLPAGCTADDIRDVYTAGYDAHMSGVTVYIDGTHEAQPKQLRHERK